jgi:anti-anti-sigma factor
MITGFNTSRVNRDVSHNGDACTISVKGNFDFNLVKPFREAYSKLEPVPTKVIVDMRHTESIDSAALGMLINMKKHLGLSDGAIEIHNCNSTIKRILSIARFEIFFSID